MHTNDDAPLKPSDPGYMTASAARFRERHPSYYRDLRGADPDGYRAYRRAHDRTKRTRGPASQHGCVGCGETAAHWALVEWPTAGTVSQSTRWRWNEDPNGYVPLCRGCHGQYDGAMRRVRRMLAEDSGEDS